MQKIKKVTECPPVSPTTLKSTPYFVKNFTASEDSFTKISTNFGLENPPPDLHKNQQSITTFEDLLDSIVIKLFDGIIRICRSIYSVHS